MAINNNQRNKIYDALNLIGPAWYESFRKAVSKDKETEWIDKNLNKLNNYEIWVNAFPTKESVYKSKSKVKQMADVYAEIQDFDKLTKEQLQYLERKNDFNAKELKEYFDGANKYKELYEKERKDAYDKEMRKREVEGRYIDYTNPGSEEQKARNWGILKNVLTSDYAKQRYINDPQSSLFGYQAPAIGEAEKTRWGASGDLAAGIAGGVADVIPPAWLIGPAIRTGRDIAYYGTEYGKTIPEIVTSAAMDFGINKGARYLANASREARAARQAMSPKAAQSLKVAEETKNIKEALGPLTFISGSSDKEIIDLVKSLPESPLKNDLLPIINSPVKGPIDRKAIETVAQRYQLETTPEIQRGIRSLIDQPNPSPDRPRYMLNASKYLEEAGTATPFKELPLRDKASYIWNKAAANINKGNVGQVAIQEAANVKGRGTDVKYNSLDEFNRKKNYFKVQMGDSWRKFGKAFAPKEKEGDPAWEAYKEVMAEIE